MDTVPTSGTDLPLKPAMVGRTAVRPYARSYDAEERQRDLLERLQRLT